MADKETEQEPVTGFQNNNPDPMAPAQQKELETDLAALNNPEVETPVRKEDVGEPARLETKEKEPITKETAKQAVEEVVEKINDGTATQEDVTTLKKQLEFYKNLFGEPTSEPITRPTATNIGTAKQQEQYDPYADVTVDQQDLIDFLSGDPTRAIPIVKKLIKGAVEISERNFTMRQQQATAQVQYKNTIQHHFYDQYKDLDQHREIVKVAGDQIEQELMQQGIRKMPHEVLSLVGDRARQIINTIRGSNSPAVVPRRGSSQGVVPGTKVSAPAKQPETEEQKEMYDLLND